MSTILQRSAWWKKRLMTMSADRQKKKHQASLAQMAMWGPALHAFVACARDHELITAEDACLADETMADWRNAPLATRLGVISLVVALLKTTLAANTPDAETVLGKFVLAMLEHPQFLLLALGVEPTQERGTARRLA